ncbi:MAG: threonine--tRNA ligase [Candidatus Niyogibacteria bacterium]|nr:threonine--tRNA ligase [Candidatus Niyogibacteria bacterium]
MTTAPIEVKRHSYAHIMAYAIKNLWPNAKFGIGPVVENGFYYDIDSKHKFSPDDLPKIEAEMRKIISSNAGFKKKIITHGDALKLFKKLGQPYKVELIKDLKKEGVKTSVYETGDFTDLCKGPHVTYTNELSPDAFKLVKIAGAYWKGDEKKAQLQRIYGLAFNTAAELQNHIKLLEEAERRDHRHLGAELKLFIFSDLVGPGLPLYTPKGATLRSTIQNYSRELRQEIGYQEVYSPQINKAELFKISGHYDKYKNDMFHVRSNYSKEEYFLKPMNCPQHTQIFASEIRSYKNMPVRIADFANLYRDEKPGELSGLTRLRAFSQDDGHCFCREDQIEEEFAAILGVIEKAMRTYGLNYYVRLSLRDEKNKKAYLGDDKVWKKSQKILEDLLKKIGIKYVLGPGEAAFYGPKMDLIAKDSLGRAWQLSTIQLDFNMPTRFKLEYVGADGKQHTPVMIHSAIAGSPERFMAILIEHYAGAFPLWLAPVQAVVLPISEKFNQYGKRVLSELSAASIRAKMDDSNETLGKRIRAAEMQKIPHILVIGEKEESAGLVAARHRETKQQETLPVADFINKLKQQITDKK